MSTYNLDTIFVFYRHSISHVLDKLWLHAAKSSSNSKLLRLAAGFLIGSMTYAAASCSSDTNKNISDAAPIQAAAGSGGSAVVTAGSGGSAPSGDTGGTVTTAVVDASAVQPDGSSVNQPTAGAGGEAADSGIDSGIDARIIVDSTVPSEGSIGDAGVDSAAVVCDKIPPPSTDCAQPLAPGDDRKCTVSVGLAQREYYLYAGKTYNPCEPTALVIDCHGAMETAGAQAGLEQHTAQTLSGPLEYPGIGSGWRLEADTGGGGFIVATPQGINNVWITSNNDPEFFIAIVEAVKQIADIDVDKVYMTGISNGAIISYQTACPHTDVFSGIAAHAAGANCTSISKPIPVISFDAAPDFAYATTVAANDTMVTLNKCTGPVDENWLTIDSNTTDAVCRNDPYDTDPTLIPCSSVGTMPSLGYGIKPTVCKRWDNCEGGVAVVFCEIAPSDMHGPANESVDAHILYGNATSLNTPSVAWRFFKEFWK